MWVFLSGSFLSIVAHKFEPGLLLVRARRRGEIETVFPKASVTETPTRDYRFRAEVPRAEVASVMAAQIEKIDYTNFKDSVSDRRRHDAYLDVWSVMHRYQKGLAGK